MAGRRLRSVLVLGTAHVFPKGLVLLVARLGTGMDLVQDAAALEGCQLLAMLRQRQRPLTHRQVQVQRRDPESLVPQELLDGDCEPAATAVPVAVAVQLHRQSPRVLLPDQVIAQPPGRIRVAQPKQIDPNGVAFGNVGHGDGPLGIMEHDRHVLVQLIIACRFLAVDAENLNLLARKTQALRGRL